MTNAAPVARLRMEPVARRAADLRVLFEVEKQFCITVLTLVYRVGDPELKYRLCEHAWESAQHARYLRDRGRELPGFPKHDTVRLEVRRVFDEAVLIENGMDALAAFYGVLKPALADAYRHYLNVTEALGDWPTTKLVEEFLRDEVRHAEEIAPSLMPNSDSESAAHVQQALDSIGGWLGERGATDLPANFVWQSDIRRHTPPTVCDRGGAPVCACSFGSDLDEYAIVPEVVYDPLVDARVIRAMVYVWLFLEMDAVDYLATVPYETQDMPFEFHADVLRHLWDESRHSQFGYRQLPRLGFDWREVEQQVNLYKALVTMAPHERYALMTQHFESGSFEIKAHIMDRVRELGDFEADTLLAYDRNDEQHHVRYGTRWLPVLLERAGVTVPVGEWLDDLRERFTALVEEVNPTIPRTLAPEKRLNARRILERYSAG